MHHHPYLGYFGNLLLVAAFGTMQFWIDLFNVGGEFLGKCGPYFAAITFILSTAVLVKKLRQRE